MDGFTHTNTGGVHIDVQKGAEVWILFGTEHRLQMGRCFGDMERGPDPDPCSLCLSVATSLEGGVANLHPEPFSFFGSFSAGLSALIPSIITVQMIIFPAPPPNSHTGLAFPVPT